MSDAPPAPLPPRSPADVLALLYPYLADAADPRHVPEADRGAALALAVHFRPSCLPLPVQDIAQAHYAAHLLTARAVLVASGGTTTTVTAGTEGGQVVEWAEGNVRLKLAEPQAAKSTTASTVSAATPVDPWKAWQALAALCVAPGDALTGGVVPGQSAAASRGYALLTGW